MGEPQQVPRPVVNTTKWQPPATIQTGAPLSSLQLNATANVPGTFVYNPPAGTVLPAGNFQTLSVTFTPTDTVDYTTATGTAAISVGNVRTCDVSNQGSPNVVDVQSMINEALGTAMPANDLNSDGAVNVADIQMVIGAVLNYGCNAG